GVVGGRCRDHLPPAAAQRFFLPMRSHDWPRLKAPVLYGSKPSSGRSSDKRGLSSTSAGRRGFAGFFCVPGRACFLPLACCRIGRRGSPEPAGGSRDTLRSRPSQRFRSLSITAVLLLPR